MKCYLPLNVILKQLMQNLKLCQELYKGTTQFQLEKHTQKQYQLTFCLS
ncbi:hypothetical protein PCYB_005980, partial [Plasmodium cynomolgi strain B]